MWMCRSTCACVEARGQSRVFQEPCTPPLIYSVSLPYSSIIRLGWLAREPRTPPYLPPLLRDYSMHYHTSLLCGLWRHNSGSCVTRLVLSWVSHLPRLVFHFLMDGRKAAMEKFLVFTFLGSILTSRFLDYQMVVVFQNLKNSQNLTAYTIVDSCQQCERLSVFLYSCKQLLLSFKIFIVILIGVNGFIWFWLAIPQWPIVLTLFFFFFFLILSCM